MTDESQKQWLKCRNNFAKKCRKYICLLQQNSQDFQSKIPKIFNFYFVFSKKTANLHISRSISQKLNGKLNVLVNVFILLSQLQQ